MYHPMWWLFHNIGYDSNYWFQLLNQAPLSVATRLQCSQREKTNKDKDIGDMMTGPEPSPPDVSDVIIPWADISPVTLRSVLQEHSWLRLFLNLSLIPHILSPRLVPQNSIWNDCCFLSLQVGLMRNGRMLAEGEPETLMKQNSAVVSSQQQCIQFT